MSVKTESLIRDVAALFVKYRMADWQPLISELEARGGSDALADAIRHHIEQACASRASKARSKPKAPGKKSPISILSVPKEVVSKSAALELEPRFTGPNAKTIVELRESLIAKRSFAAMSHLKAVITALGIKGAGAGRRDVLVNTLTEYLDQLDAERFERALHILAREEKSNRSGAVLAYDRWFDLITSDRRGKRKQTPA